MFSKWYLSIIIDLLLLPFPAQSREIVATREWQEIGPGDTLPAGLEIRMDLDKGGTWARLPEEEPKAEEIHHCDSNCKERLAKRRQAGSLRGRRGRFSSEEYRVLNVTALASSGSTFLKVLGFATMVLALGAVVVVAGRMRRSWRVGTHEL